MTDTELIRSLQQQCLSAGENDFAQFRNALTFLPDRSLEALGIMETVCRRQKSTLASVGFHYCAAYTDRLLGNLLGAKRKMQEHPPSRESLVKLVALLDASLGGLYSYFRDISKSHLDTADLAQMRSPLLAAVEAWSPIEGEAKRQTNWQAETKSRLALFKEAVKKMPETPVESIRVVIGVCRTLNETMKLAGFQHCANYIQKIQTALLMIETRVSNRLGTSEDMLLLSVVLDDTLRDFTSYFREIDDYGGDAIERADARMDTATTLAGWRQSTSNNPVAPTAAAEPKKLTQKDALDEGRRGFPLMKEAIRNFLQHPLESVRAINGICRKLDVSAHEVGFKNCGGLVKRFSHALGRLESLFTARPPHMVEREMLQVIVEEAVNAIIAHYHEINERGMSDLAESVQMRLDFIVPLEEWQPAPDLPSEETEQKRAEGFLPEAKKEIRLFGEAVAGLPQHPQESIELLLGVCQRLSTGLQVDDYPFFAGHISSIAVAIERNGQWVKRQQLSERALATLSILLDDVHRGLASYLHEVKERGVDAAECAQVRGDQLAALLGWGGSEGVEEVPADLQKKEESAEQKRDAFFKEAERTVALLSEAISVVPQQPKESLGTSIKLCRTLAARFKDLGFHSAAEYTEDIERSVSGLLSRLDPSQGGLDDIAILLDEVALSLVSYLEELRMRGADAPECAEGRIFVVESLVAWLPPAAAQAHAAVELFSDPSPVTEKVTLNVAAAPSAASQVPVALPTDAASSAAAQVPVALPSDAAPDVSGEGMFLVFETQGRRYALPVEKVREVVFSQPIFPLPFDRPDVLGMMNYRGDAVPVLSLGGQATEGGYVLLTSIDGTPCGFAAERVVEVSSLSGATFEKAPRAQANAWVTRQAKAGEQTLLIVDSGNV